MKRRFVSFDRQTACDAEYEEPDRYRALFALPAGRATAAQGSGLSYVAASFGAGVTSVGMRRFNRILAFDPAARWIEVEAGISLGELDAFCGPHRLTLAVQPGHPQITIGGCVAANVHGKNQYRDGLFGDHVIQLRLFHPQHGCLDLSRDANRELFELTLGGLGLTGIILSARLALVPVSSPTMVVEHTPVESIGDAFARIAALRPTAEMAYAWLDLADRRRPGRGYLIAANCGDDDSRAARPLKYARLDPARKKLRLPLLNAATVPAINRVYRYLGLRRRAAHCVDRAAVLFPAVGKERYFDGYGDGGFIELQVLVPEAAAPAYAEALPRLVRARSATVGLTTVKAFRGKTTLLNYTGDGFSFTIDVPSTRASRDLLTALDSLNCDVGAVTAVVKDSRLSAAVVRRQYAEYDRFKSRLHDFDPSRLFRSALSERLDL